MNTRRGIEPDSGIRGKRMSEVKRYMHSDQRGSVEVVRGKYVLYEDYTELKAQRDALAAENASLAEFIKKDCCVYRSGMVVNAEAYLPDTPATDAYLNSVRAEAVQELADAWYAIANETSEGVSISDSTRLKYRQRADDAADFAAQLRAGKDGE